jgi:hypothetical protein
VAFGSSSKRHSTEEAALLMAHQVEQLNQKNRTLEEKLRWTEGRYSQSVTLARQLNQTLLQEKQRAEALARELRDTQQSRPQAAQSSPQASGS